jgi:hypothetical protein
MINSLMQKRFSALATYLVAFCLLFAGMRVPDPARPQRPKPSQRAVLEYESKPSKQSISKFSDVIAVIPAPPELRITLTHSTEFVSTFHSFACPPLFPNSSRAPPLSLS